MIKSTASNRLTVEGHGMGQYLVEALRADFDGDGLEADVGLRIWVRDGRHAPLRRRPHTGSKNG